MKPSNPRRASSARSAATRGAVDVLSLSSSNDWKRVSNMAGTLLTGSMRGKVHATLMDRTNIVNELPPCMRPLQRSHATSRGCRNRVASYIAVRRNARRCRSTLEQESPPDGARPPLHTDCHCRVPNFGGCHSRRTGGQELVAPVDRRDRRVAPAQGGGRDPTPSL